MTRLDAIVNNIDEVVIDSHDFLLDIARQARMVRQLQKQYFKTRDKSDLIASKDAECDLDRLLAEEV